MSIKPLSLTLLQRAQTHNITFIMLCGEIKRGFIIIAEKNIYIYSESSLGPHLLLQSGFYISQEEIGWNSQHHSKLINETKSHNLKYRFIHLTNEAVYWWLIAVFVLVNDSFSLCTAASKNTGT